MFNSGRSTYVLASVLAVIVHVGLATLLIIYHDEIAKIQLVSNEPLKLTLVKKDFQPIELKPVQSRLLIEKAPPPKPTIKKPEPTQPADIKKQKVAKTVKKKAKKPLPTKKPTKKKTEKKEPKPDPLVQKLKEIKQTKQTKTQETKIPDSPELKLAKRYVSRIQKQIEKNWTKPLNVQYQEMAGLKVLIRLLLSRDGRLEKAQIIQSSGNSQFDRSALNAVYKTGQFQVPGDADVFEKYFRHLTISYNL